MSGIPHPYFTAELPGIAGTLKQRPEDFVVAEVPLYEPCGDGEHIYFGLEKHDLSTPEALERIRRALGVSPQQIGHAGLKDRRAVTRQQISVTGCELEQVRELSLPQTRILWVKRHTNKLRVGHLRGNIFELRLRDVAEGAAERIPAILETCQREGVPNYYGFQRFGNRGNAHLIGRAFVLGDYRRAVRHILGYPAPEENNPHVVRARELFMEGDIKGAHENYPSTYRDELRMLNVLLNDPENYERAARRMSISGRKLYCSAYQSYLFNLVLDERLRRVGRRLGTLFVGDLAYLHRNGAVFRVTDTEAEQSRAKVFELSPSGPIFGKKMARPEGEAAAIEKEVLARDGIELDAFDRVASELHLDGGRRSLRIHVEELEWRLEGRDLYLKFFLPKGSYATTFVRELMKNESVAEGYYQDGEGEKHQLWRPVPTERIE